MDNTKNIGTIGLSADDVKEETPEELKRRKKEEKQAILQNELEMKAMIHHKSWERKNAKRARFRPLKNFGWWFLGFLSFIVITAGALFGTAYFLKVKDIAGSDSSKYVSDEIAEKSLLEAALGLPNYTVGEVPIIKELVSSLIDSVGVGEYIEIDLESLNSTKIISGEILTAFLNSITVVATLDKIGVTDSLGSFGDIKAMNEFELVAPEDMPNETGTDFNAKLYYYLDDENNYKVAFNENHQRVEGAEGKDLYFPALKDVVILDLPSVLGDRLNREKVSGLLTSFGFEEDNTFCKILGDTTVEEMPNFDMNGVNVDYIIELPEEGADNYESVKQLYSVLLDATGKEYDDTDYESFKASCDEIKVGDLSNINIDLVKLTSVITLPEEGADDYDQVSRIYKIILDATNVSYNGENFREMCQEVTLRSIGNMDTDKIKIVTVLDESANGQLYDILRDITGAEENSQMTVGSLAKSDITHIKLLNVLRIEENSKKEANEKLYNVLRDLSYENVIEQMIIDQMIEEAKNPLSPLHTSDFDDYDNLGYEQKAELVKGMRTTYSKLSGEEKTARRLDAEEAYAALGDDADGIMKKNALITVASLDGAKIEDIKLKTVLSEDTGNAFVDKLLKKDGITISNLGDELNNLTLAEIYEVQVFASKKEIDESADETEESKKLSTITFTDGEVAYYAKSQDENGKDVYTISNEELSDDDKYYITDKASIWLFMLFDCEDKDDRGFGTKYTANNKTLSSIDDSIADMSGKIMNATIRQLVFAGIVSKETVYGTSVFALSLGTALSMIPSTI